MAIDIVLVNLLGLAAVAWIVWFFWVSRNAGVRAERVDGIQSALVVVKGGYTPDTIVVERRRPVRLVFRREESAGCSERVVIPAFDKAVWLPEGTEVAIEFVPSAPGEYPFSCQMGIFRGRIVVE